MWIIGNMIITKGKTKNSAQAYMHNTQFPFMIFF